MYFNSLDYILFLFLFFILYWSRYTKIEENKNLLLLFGSYFFYSLWDIRFLILIIYTSVINYLIGSEIFNSKKERRKHLLIVLSVVSNLGVLFVFKYFNFFIDTLNIFINSSSALENFNSLKIILPVGISFYTFQSMSYTIDIYKKKIDPAKDFIAFLAFISFFPQLIAGPIERAKNLLPQFLSKKKFNIKKAKEGVNLIIWGLFKKVVIADNLAIYVNDIFNHYEHFNGGVLALGVIYFSFQIYCDFSGYSDIAIGSAKILGFELVSNFRFPYFSKSISEFWRRWHISLSSWFRDYLFIPLGGSRKGLIRTNLNILIVFLLSGIWHGANNTFIIWGFIHCGFYLISKTLRKLLDDFDVKFESNKLITGINILTTYSIVTFAWIFFRSESTGHAFDYILQLMQNIDFPDVKRFGLLFVFGLLFLELLVFKDERNIIFSKIKLLNNVIYLALIYLTLANSINDSEFIYFQF